MDCISLSKWVRNISVHMEMDTIASDDSGLSAMGELAIGHMTYQTVFWAASHQQMWAVPLRNWSLIAHHLYVSAQQAHLSPHLELITSVGFHSCEMFILERWVHCYRSTTDGCDCALLSLSMDKTCGSDHDLFPYSPVNRVNYFNHKPI